jgi:hypothetical protein
MHNKKRITILSEPNNSYNRGLPPSFSGVYVAHVIHKWRNRYYPVYRRNVYEHNFFITFAKNPTMCHASCFAFEMEFDHTARYSIFYTLLMYQKARYVNSQDKYNMECRK